MEPGTSKRIVDLIVETHNKAKIKDTKKSGGFKLNFTSTQWIILGTMFAVLVLSGLLLIALLLNF
jgi:hypothetical protein